MAYQVKEIYFTLQGEGAQTGRGAVFLRFAGCNLWTGREEDRAKAVCQFCDTDFAGVDGPGGGKFADAASLTAAVLSHWPKSASANTKPYVVCTGGEPMLQLDAPLIGALHQAGFEIGVESNGTIAAPDGLDWICISPKANSALKQTRGNELKLVHPQQGVDPSSFEGLDFQHFFLQPMDSPAREENTRAVIEYCMKRPLWRLSLQTHKLIGLK